MFFNFPVFSLQLACVFISRKEKPTLQRLAQSGGFRPETHRSAEGSTRPNTGRRRRPLAPAPRRDRALLTPRSSYDASDTAEFTETSDLLLTLRGQRSGEDLTDPESGHASSASVRAHLSHEGPGTHERMSVCPHCVPAAPPPP